MYLVQILLPVQDQAGQPFAPGLYSELARDLTGRFGGLTAYTQAPAEGIGEEGPGGRAVREPVVIYEVMVDALERTWWRALRERLQLQFHQAELVIRAHRFSRL